MKQLYFRTFDVLILFYIYCLVEVILIHFVRGATQKFGEFKQAARTGCRMPFRH